jgi:hypothetical protein
VDQSPDELPEEEDPRHHALETAAEVLGGLATALDRFAAGATT